MPSWLKTVFRPTAPHTPSTTALFGDFLSGCLVLFASLFMVFEISLEFEMQRKGKK